MRMDLEELYRIMEKFERSGLSELAWKKDGEELTLKKGGLQAAPHPVGHSPAPAYEAPSETRGEIIRAPLVGTFYRSAAPDAPPFVERGTAVKKGQTLCILEAMKLMNEFQAEFDLVIADILAENGAMVEFGTPLFEVQRA
jgi:acetyl-CoA carboxylase biotin carboxyl carrier protein